MVTTVIDCSGNLQVAGIVVALVTINVVNDFLRLEEPTKMILDNNPM